MILLQKRPVIILQNIAFQLIGCCGLDCETCDARVATVTNDDALREKTAALWTKLNGVTITPEAYREAGEHRSAYRAIHRHYPDRFGTPLGLGHRFSGA